VASGKVETVTSYTEWIEQVPGAIKDDGLWKLDVYRKALFLSDLAWHDCEKLLKHPLGKPIAWQLIRSAGSIPANMEEGFGRGFGREYGRFLKISLGSARETRGWYYRGHNILERDVIEHRFKILGTIIAGLITLSSQQSHR
jgi:four helix bundle protein